MKPNLPNTENFSTASSSKIRQLSEQPSCSNSYKKLRHEMGSDNSNIDDPLDDYDDRKKKLAKKKAAFKAKKGYTTGQNKSDNSFEFEVEKSMDRKEPENGDEEESTEDDYRHAYSSVEKSLRKISLLPIQRPSHHTFCVFCSESYPPVEFHFCIFMTAAQKEVNQSVNEFLGKADTINKKMLESLKKFIHTSKVDTIAKHSRMENTSMKKNSDSPKKLKRPSTDPNPISKRFRHISDESTSSSSLAKNKSRSVTPDALPFAMIDSQEHRTQSGRVVKRPNLFCHKEVQIRKETVQKEGLKKKRVNKEKEVEQESTILLGISESERKRNRNMIRRLLANGFELPGDDYVLPPLPADKSTWTREQHKMDIYGPIYCALQSFKPAYTTDMTSEFLEDDGDTEFKSENSESDSDSEDEQKVENDVASSADDIEFIEIVEAERKMDQNLAQQVRSSFVTTAENTENNMLMEDDSSEQGSSKFNRNASRRSTENIEFITIDDDDDDDNDIEIIA
ncbi:Protein hrde-4 [Caenorhabditis elegans]|nr:Protein hrde-4 [Caenorhabditis elegans]CCD66247.1 Protein hrde-4 [Caenorhabditis elegans]|eukprot:NP_001040683.2 Protein hrde-4 [Caenorhabditis elegans]